MASLVQNAKPRLAVAEGLALPSMPVRLRLTSQLVAMLEGGKGGSGDAPSGGDPSEGADTSGPITEGGTPDPDG